MNQLGENQLQIEKPNVIQLACYNKGINQGSSSELIAKGEATLIQFGYNNSRWL